MKLIGAIQSIMQLVCALVPHSVTKANAVDLEEGKTSYEVSFRGDVSFEAVKGTSLNTTFGYELEKVRLEIGRLLVAIIPVSIMTKDLANALSVMDAIYLEIRHNQSCGSVDGLLILTINRLPFYFGINEDHYIDHFPQFYWNGLISTLSTFNSEIMTEQGPRYITKQRK